MKKIFTFAVSALMASAVWANVITLDLNKPINPASLEYNENGIWTQCYNDVDYTWLEFGDADGEFMLSHLIDGEGASWGGYYWDGFCPAIGGDQTDYGQPGSSASWTTYFGGCMAGGGCVINADGSVTADPAQPYLVAYYSSWAMEGPSNQVMFVDKEGNTTFEPVGVYVCNHPWPYYGCEHGDGFGEPFGEGDYFELIAHGVAADGSETTVSINLVEFVDGELHALNDWTFFDLSSLGEVESVYFTMNSTDSGDYGMNTAAYFCMDKFQVKGEEETPVEPEDPYATGLWLVQINADGKLIHTELFPGQNGDFVNVDDVTYPEFYEICGFYFLIDGVAYGAPEDMTLANLGDADQNPLVPGENTYYVGVGYSYTFGIHFIYDQDTMEFMGYSAYVAKGGRVDVDEVAAGKTVAGVRYFNMAGQEMQEANGMTIVVTTYTDGTTSAVKVIK